MREFKGCEGPLGGFDLEKMDGKKRGGGVKPKRCKYCWNSGKTRDPGT